MTRNKLLDQESKFIDMLKEVSSKINRLNSDFKTKLDKFSENVKVKERDCFWCDKCNKRLKPNEMFIKYEVWKSQFHYRNDIIANKLKSKYSREMSIIYNFSNHYGDKNTIAIYFSYPTL